MKTFVFLVFVAIVAIVAYVSRKKSINIGGASAQQEDKKDYTQESEQEIK